eukprot:CAMPEP_0197637856 /NCGR_PEP_ID=MMETSP1338-20131121/12957_1 /TAXON_ID=43686 ORGANISM="Pelagodinium beii, Strain RCC1491" /NCGR_SAMPLE_ID=MMETSP1338 /ASSEMBLY_ACC=CAM_ASM_000754 /LENGTH=41 /DNA_ID= /DNA_START= /DNA_END= /DNA_ORIENTATION=
MNHLQHEKRNADEERNTNHSAARRAPVDTIRNAGYGWQYAG